MARRRMFSMELISSDKFLGLPVTAQSFYFHLGMHADDEGFVSAPNSLGLLCKGTQRDLDALEEKGYVIRFDSGVLVIVDWMLNNTIRKERSMETIHRAEKSMLQLIDGRYVFKCTADNVTDTATDVTTNLTPKGDSFFDEECAPQNRKEHNIIDKSIPEQNSPKNSSPDRDDEYSCIFDEAEDQTGKEGVIHSDKETSGKGPGLAVIKQYCTDEGLEYIKPTEFWVYYNGKGWKDRDNKPVINWKALAKSWDERNKRVSKPKESVPTWTVGTVL